MTFNIQLYYFDTQLRLCYIHQISEPQQDKSRTTFSKI